MVFVSLAPAPSGLPGAARIGAGRVLSVRRGHGRAPRRPAGPALGFSLGALLLAPLLEIAWRQLCRGLR